MDCNCMTFAVVVNQLTLDQTLKNLTCDDLEIPLVVIRLGLEKDWVGVPVGLVWGNGAVRVV